MLMFQPLRKYADFKGRATRSEYWQFILFQGIAGGMLGFISSADGASSPLPSLSLLFTFAVWIPTLAVSVRRFHDSGRTGWWVLFPPAVLIITLSLFVGIKGTEIAQSFSAVASSDRLSVIQDVMRGISDIVTWVFLPTWLASVVTFVFHVMPGTAGANRFGPDPRDGSSANISAFDDERIDAAIAEAHGGKRERDPNYKPVFDFTSPLPATAAVSETPAPPPPPVHRAPQTPTFGKRR